MVFRGKFVYIYIYIYTHKYIYLMKYIRKYIIKNIISYIKNLSYLIFSFFLGVSGGRRKGEGFTF